MGAGFNFPSLGSRVSRVNPSKATISGVSVMHVQ